MAKREKLTETVSELELALQRLWELSHKHPELSDKIRPIYDLVLRSQVAKKGDNQGINLVRSSSEALSDAIRCVLSSDDKRIQGKGIADLFNISASAISCVVNQRREFPKTKVDRACEVLDLKLEELITSNVHSIADKITRLVLDERNNMSDNV
jgi:hypothetical protein